MSRITSEQICDAVERSADRIFEWTKTLIQFPSENRPPGGAEGAAQAFLASE